MPHGGIYNESFFTQQLQGVTHHLVKCQKKLLDLGKSLERWQRGKRRGKKPTIPAVRKSVNHILSPQFMKELIATEVTPDKKTGLPRLVYQVDHEALQRLSQEPPSWPLIISTNARQIVEAYRSLWVVEDAFKSMKNTDFLRWQPAHHWTDQKLRVHAIAY